MAIAPSTEGSVCLSGGRVEFPARLLLEVHPDVYILPYTHESAHAHVARARGRGKKSRSPVTFRGFQASKFGL